MRNAGEDPLVLLRLRVQPVAGDAERREPSPAVKRPKPSGELL